MSAVLEAREPSARYIEALQPPLVKHFDLIASAPGGVARLRDLILTLAVQGRLVPQNPNDEPASALLARVRAEKARLVSLGQLRSERPSLSIGAHEKPFQLPSGWAWARFGEVSINRDGERIPVASTEREGRAKIYDYYGASGVIDKIDGYLFDKTLLLIGEDGANLLNRSTPIAFLAHGKYWVNNHAHVIDTTEPELVRYLNLFINAIPLDEYVTGTAQPKMNQAKLNSIVVPLPPSREQSQIVARVDELMRLCDALEEKGRLETRQHQQLLNVLLDALTTSDSTEEAAANWAGVAANFDHLLERADAVDALERSIVEMAVRGLLVRQQPTDIPATEFLQCVQVAQAQASATGKSKPDTPDVVLEEEAVPFTVPTGWAWVRFGAVVSVSGGVTLGRKTRIAKPILLPYLRVANVQRSRLDLSAIKSVTIDESELARFELRAGDLLITEGGDWDKVGRTAIWRDELSKCLHQNHVFKARGLVDDWVPAWAELYLNSANARTYFAGSAKQTTNLASINMTELKACPFPIPPIGEQHRIVARVDQLRRFCSALRERLSAARVVEGRLVETLIQQAEGNV